MSIFFVQIIIGKKKSKQNCLKRNKPYSLIKTTWTQCGYFLIFIHELLLLKDSWDYFFCFWIVDLLSFNLNIMYSFLHLILYRKLKTNIRHHQSQKTAIYHFESLFSISFFGFTFTSFSMIISSFRQRKVFHDLL